MKQTPKRAGIERIFDRYNARDLDPIDELFHPDYVEHTPWGVIQGLTTIKEFVQSCLLNPFPDARFEAFNIEVDGDRAVWWVRFTGTNTVGFAPTCIAGLPGRHAPMRWSLMGMPPTGRSVDLVGLHAGRLTDDNRLIEHWSAHEQLAVIQQSGFAPTIAAALTRGLRRTSVIGVEASGS
jgi:predicted ester cyclase